MTEGRDDGLLSLPLKEIGQRIRAVRGQLSQDRFGAGLGVSGQYVSAVEAGKVKPSLALLVAIATKYGVSLDWLVLGRRPPEEGCQVEPPTVPIGDRSLEDLAGLLSALWKLAISSDDKTRIWLEVQLKRAIPELQYVVEDTKKQQAAAG